MAKKRTNIFEMLLSELLVDKKVYDNDDNQFTVNKVRYDVKTNTVYAINTSGDTLTFFIDDVIDLESEMDIQNDLDVSKIKKLNNKSRRP